MFSSKSVYQATIEGNLIEDHRGVKYCCGQCGKHFSQKRSLDEHQRGVHEGVKYPCSKFEFKATTRSYLAVRHTPGLKDYLCFIGDENLFFVFPYFFYVFKLICTS